MSTKLEEVDLLEEQGFSIVSQAFDSWNVRFLVPVAELVDQQALLEHLRNIKHGVSKRYSVQESDLLFDGIVKRVQQSDVVDVVVRIRKPFKEKGDPKVHFEDGIGTDKSRYSHMMALLDIMYLDQSETPITLHGVMQAVTQASIAPQLLDKDIIARKVREVLEKRTPIKNIRIAKGIFPDIGQNAKMEFFFQATVTPDNTSEYRSSRRVSSGDLLCRKTPPTLGENAGMNVHGKQLLPHTQVDIQLEVGPGATLSLDGNEAVADVDGVVVISQTMKRIKTRRGTREFPESVLMKVTPALKVEGDQILDIASSQSVEVFGDLYAGSRIITDSEVYVSGDVEEGTMVEALDDIIVEGGVHGATLASEANVLTKKDVTDSRLVAKDQIVIKGSVKNSDLTGDTVTAESITGSRIVAQRNVNLRRINADENNIISAVCVGMNGFLSERFEKNKAFIKNAKSNLTRMELVVGPEIVREVTSFNIPSMMTRFLSQNRDKKVELRKQIENYRKLIESIPPTRALLEQKVMENRDIAKKLEQTKKGDRGEVTIREGMEAKTTFSIDGIEAEVESVGSPIKVKSDGKENLIISKIKDASRQAKSA